MTDDPEVILHKRVKVDGKPGKAIPSKLRRGALNWEPPYPEGEDEVSMSATRKPLGLNGKGEILTREKLRRE